MQKLLMFAGICIFLVAQMAIAQSSYDNKIRKAHSMPQSWFTCQATADCGLVTVPCQVSLAVNYTHREDAQNAICGVSGCNAACDASMNDNAYAVCQKGQCITRRPKPVKATYTTWHTKKGKPAKANAPKPITQ